MQPFESFAEFATLADRLPAADEAIRAEAQARQDSLTKPQGSLGRLEELALHWAAWRGTVRPEIKKAQGIVFAGNHGICVHGVAPFPQEVTVQMVANFEAGGAGINQLCRAAGAELKVVKLDLDRPTQDFTTAPAMTEAETIAALNVGFASVDTDADALIIGEMGVGNSTIAAALAAAVFGGPAVDWVGPGTGSDAEGIKRKIAVVDKGLALHSGLGGMETLAALGGREQAAMCGAILGARAARIPVILDGFICTSAAGTLYKVDPRLLDHCVVGHSSAEPGHRLMLEAMGKRALMQMDMRLGEGTGAALALGVVRAALECHNGMATFAEAGVSEG
ncbi:nicotinate-nucleotide-dimethylbenzimidazole phosphoribosyltransferase [Rhodobacter aestuarii]|uniref:Nicotinate-nucleotide--dimethylbenzimidazole phosphoribosyltransferase n=1 Tax=Rhodobacter aestuarii TaxID=453582 RepID=A0A1N7J3M3_9RHOB|nr:MULTISPECIES: nicotinate-nucleotide--dimethylbenzimidazole phosphoribosyltransferase [Rhodobacter]PTV97233.1 nicotinate-nucleotide-dimethylbenzimidazole phosphoribosyltransferase [Rhodobacter aestuarii]SIS43821.1 nicotinate-nucleotide-dimethylbenzimidazole phosphoribosyltransferase [Rhodobacter aestuarii]SOB99272.1 nicotinate-nucleotide-dimethylbenzimidazole phosphoribosyltransferase [Rhodobacter sp. JA431]